MRNPENRVHRGPCHAAASTLKVKAKLRAGQIAANHASTLKVKTRLRAGQISANHASTLKVKTRLRAGGISTSP